jgi:Zn-dependent peptidase ImmA (M78 family)/transcriptional regulator with XRE-family HTH domain
MLSERLNQARQAKGLSLRALAEKVGVSAMMLSKYERAESMPSSDVLLALSDALGVRTEYFFRTTSIDLKRIEHRNKHRWKLPKLEEKKVLADVRDQLERWAVLDTVTPAPWSVPFALPANLPERIDSLDAIEDIAIAVRGHWNLGLNPIADLIDVLETHGIKVFTTRFDDPRFEGMCARAGEHHVVVVGRQWPGDRQRFTLAHELGHLVLDERLSDNVDKEKAADRFAGSFLVPKPKVIAALGARRRSLEVYELYLLKQEFGLSIGGWSYRALNVNVFSKAAHAEFWRQLVRKGWNKTEPGEPCPPEKPRLFEQTVYRTLSEDLIGESKAAELLSMTVSRLAAHRRMDVVNDDSGE